MTPNQTHLLNANVFHVAWTNILYNVIIFSRENQHNVRHVTDHREREWQILIGEVRIVFRKHTSRNFPRQ